MTYHVTSTVMDDRLGQPSFSPPSDQDAASEELSADEDEGPDWTKLP